jgi:hypothetical protein
MAVAYVFESDQVDESGYEGLLKAIGRESLQAPLPDGALAHLAGPKPGGGWRVVDVWESAEAADAFYGSEQFRPVVAGSESMGITTTPWPMHRLEIGQVVKTQG